MLIVSFSDTYRTERAYICNVLFKEFLGLEFQVKYADQKHWTIRAGENVPIVLPDILFQTPRDKWLTPSSLPAGPLQSWDTRKDGIDCPLVDPVIPIIYGDENFPQRQAALFGEQKAENEKQHILPIDILGSAFFMLTRYEEVVKPDRDEHDRFPAAAGLAFQEGFLDRPIINEYLEILWSFIKKGTNNEQRTTKNFAVVPTHDVDSPFQYRLLPRWKVGRRLAGDLVKRKSPGLFCRNAWRIATRHKDPYDTFNQIMDISESAGVSSSFYFMAGGTTRYDEAYPVDHPSVREIIKTIHDRGHCVGFHPSYAAGLNQAIWQEELATLHRAVGSTPLVGGREHYLRFQAPLTWRFWAESELEYDTTLSFADAAGFRCGICYPYLVFDLEQRKQLDLIERPLIMMECTVIDERYMDMGITHHALEYMQKLKNRCRMFNGEFVLLWHNTRFVTTGEVNMYSELLGA